MNAELKVIAPAWEAIQRATKLGPIKSKAHYTEMLRLSDSLIEAIGTDHAHPLNTLLFIVGDLIRAYDRKHYKILGATPSEVVEFLMVQHQLRQSDLPEIGAQSVVSAVLSGQRELNTGQIKRLCGRFGVSADVFLWRPQARLGSTIAPWAVTC